MINFELNFQGNVSSSPVSFTMIFVTFPQSRWLNIIHFYTFLFKFVLFFTDRIVSSRVNAIVMGVPWYSSKGCEVPGKGSG